MVVLIHYRWPGWLLPGRPAGRLLSLPLASDQLPIILLDASRLFRNTRRMEGAQGCDEEQGWNGLSHRLRMNRGGNEGGGCEKKYLMNERAILGGSLIYDLMNT